MQEKMTLARPYARAVFAHAREQGALDAWMEVLGFLAAAVQEPSFRRLIRNPKVPGEALERLLDELLGPRLFAAARNFVHLLVTSKRLELAPEIARMCAALRARAERTAPVRVVTAFALDEKDRARLEAVIAKYVGSKITLESSVDRSLIGGAVVKVGDRVIDASVRGRLAQLSQRLA